MALVIAQSSTAIRTSRRLRPTPDRLAVAALVAAGALWLFDYFRGFGLFYQKGWAVLLAVVVVAAAVGAMLVWWLGGWFFAGGFNFAFVR